MDVEVLAAPDGRMLVRWENGSAASFTDGHWIPSVEFDFYELNEEFTLIDHEELKGRASKVALECLRAH